MICGTCGQRWAPFPEEDFTITENGIFPKNRAAERRRKRAFISNEVRNCSRCAEHCSEIIRRESMANALFPIPSIAS